MDGHESVADVAVCKMCTCHPYGDALNGADISTRCKVIKNRFVLYCKLDDDIPTK